jgi:hypothetical protein
VLEEWDFQTGSHEMKDVDGEHGCAEGKVCFSMVGKNIVWFQVWRVAESDCCHVWRETPYGSGDR